MQESTLLLFLLPCILTVASQWRSQKINYELGKALPPFSSVFFLCFLFSLFLFSLFASFSFSFFLSLRSRTFEFRLWDLWSGYASVALFANCVRFVCCIHCIPKESFNKSLLCDDFRDIAVSPILSKVFEYCVLDRFSNYFCTTDNKFGFKNCVGCSFAIRTVRNIVDSYIRGGSTANLCAIDLSKAFDKVNHHALFLKLMRRHIPNELLNILDTWLSGCYSCVKWLTVWSVSYTHLTLPTNREV